MNSDSGITSAASLGFELEEAAYSTASVTSDSTAVNGSRGTTSSRATTGSIAAGSIDAPPNGSIAYERFKRAFDVVGAVVVLILSAPFWILATLAIKLTDWGPVLYVHQRVGKGGKEFRCYKFRSMIVGADELKEKLLVDNVHDDLRTFKLPNDPRLTWIGRWIRKLSIDELPQLLNVLRGEMSLVGPRPPVPSEVRLYSRLDHQRLSVRPGLTCIWQVSGRSNLAFPIQVSMDLEYIERRNLWLDLKLLALTLPAVLFCRGAL